MATTMTFVLEGRDRLSRVLNNASRTAGRAERRLAAFGAAIPVASSIAPFAGAIAGAGVAVAAFGAAVVPQILSLAEASQAQKKYREAVEESGAASEEAAKAEVAYHRTVSKMPSATRESAAAFSVLKTETRDWSDSLASVTMTPVTKGLQLTNALLPHTSGLVKGASGQLDRLMTIAGGGMATPGFDTFMGKVEDFAVGSMRDAVNGLVHFARVADSGEIGGGVKDFMDFAREQGPLVGDTLKQVAIAAVHLLTAASDVGVGLLQIANAAARVVAALPPGFLTIVLQLAVAMRAVTLARAGLLLVAGAYGIIRAQIIAAGRAAIGASGFVGTLTAAFGALSTKAKLAVAATGIGLLVVGLMQLSEIGQEAPPDVDKLTTSLGELGRTGKVSGEAARVFGTDLKGLGDSLRTLSRPSNLDKTQQFLTSLIGMDSTPVKDAKKDFDAVDKALTNLVQGGKADLAAAALERITANLKKQGYTSEEIKSQLDDYNSALADQRLEAELTAQSMGLFGEQARKTQQALAAQKLSADGLRQSIVALNDVQRQGLGGMIAFEASVDAAAKAAKENAGSLSYVNGQLDLNSPKAQAAATALQDLAQKTDEAASANRESTGSWQGAIGIYERGRQQLVKNAMQMGLTRTEAEKLAAQILKTPNKTAMLKADITDWKTKISEAEKQLKTAKGDKKAKLTADILNWKTQVAQAERQLITAKDDKKAKLTADIAVWRARVSQAEHQLKTAKGSKKAQLTANIDDWRSKIRSAQGQINSLPASKNTTLTITTRYVTQYLTGRSQHDIVGATGGLYTGSGFRTHYDTGGLVRGPGTGTSDSVPAPWLSNGEYVIKAAAVAKYGVRMFDVLNAMRAPAVAMPRSAPASTVASAVAAPAPAPVGGEFTGQLVLDSGELLGVIRGTVRPLIREAQDEAAYRQKVGRVVG
ncbi:hypothetical protein ACFWR9_11580 [Streptomyces sp. NPDC058534]|uniref:hypothetical protein n=1 Tax=Streptomyces sp. NPDC058534 TaxID=3346541 RepID=UPI0036542019